MKSGLFKSVIGRLTDDGFSFSYLKSIVIYHVEKSPKALAKWWQFVRSWNTCLDNGSQTPILKVSRLLNKILRNNDITFKMGHFHFHPTLSDFITRAHSLSCVSGDGCCSTCIPTVLMSTAANNSPAASTSWKKVCKICVANFSKLGNPFTWGLKCIMCRPE